MSGRCLHRAGFAPKNVETSQPERWEADLNRVDPGAVVGEDAVGRLDVGEGDVSGAYHFQHLPFTFRVMDFGSRGLGSREMRLISLSI